MKVSLPDYLKPYLWSYDLEKLDKEVDKRVIISQVLNWGDEHALKWINANYTENEIRQVVTRPARGQWNRERLRVWLNRFDQVLDPVTYEVAIQEMIQPSRRLLDIFWSRVDIHA